MYDREQITEVLNKESFLEWLLDFNGETYAGTSCDSGKCPVANYISSKLPLPDRLHFRVLEDRVIIVNNLEDEQLELATPEWVTKFVRLLDEEELVPYTVNDCIYFMKQAENYDY